MKKKKLVIILLSLVSHLSFASNEKMIDGLNRIEAILSTEKTKSLNPQIVWQSLKAFEEKLYYTFAHDPSGLSLQDVPPALRSVELTKVLVSDWTKLSSEAHRYGIGQGFKEWTVLEEHIEGIIEMRNRSLFAQSRKSLKSGALTQAIEDVSRVWSRRWLSENPQVTFVYDEQQVNYLKKLIVDLRTQMTSSPRSPAGQQEPINLSVMSTTLLFIGVSVIFFFLGYSFPKKKAKAQQNFSEANESLTTFDYNAWVKELSDGIDHLMDKRDIRLLGSEKCEALSHSMRELRVSFMLAQSESELRDLAQQLSTMSMELENLLQRVVSHEENEAFEQVMKTVIQLCLHFEKKQTTELKLAA